MWATQCRSFFLQKRDSQRHIFLFAILRPSHQAPNSLVYSTSHAIEGICHRWNIVSTAWPDLRLVCDHTCYHKVLDNEEFLAILSLFDF